MQFSSPVIALQMPHINSRTAVSIREKINQPAINTPRVTPSQGPLTSVGTASTQQGEESPAPEARPANKPRQGRQLQHCNQPTIDTMIDELQSYGMAASSTALHTVVSSLLVSEQMGTCRVHRHHRLIAYVPRARGRVGSTNEI